MAVHSIFSSQSMIRRLLHRWTRNRRVRVIRINGEPYIYRYFAGRSKRWTVYLHRMVRPDAERWVHNHPWDFSLAIVLAGGYWEERLTGLCAGSGLQLMARWVGGFRRVNILRRNSFHRIIEPRPETWTLFIHRRRRTRKWGFLELEPWGAGLRVIFHQPLDTTESVGWTYHGPLAKDVEGA